MSFMIYLKGLRKFAVYTIKNQTGIVTKILQGKIEEELTASFFRNGTLKDELTNLDQDNEVVYLYHTKDNLHATNVSTCNQRIVPSFRQHDPVSAANAIFLVPTNPAAGASSSTLTLAAQASGAESLPPVQIINRAQPGGSFVILQLSKPTEPCNLVTNNELVVKQNSICDGEVNKDVPNFKFPSQSSSGAESLQPVEVTNQAQPGRSLVILQLRKPTEPCNFVTNNELVVNQNSICDGEVKKNVPSFKFPSGNDLDIDFDMWHLMPAELAMPKNVNGGGRQCSLRSLRPLLPKINALQTNSSFTRSIMKKAPSNNT